MNPSHEREQALFILAAAKPVAERAAFLDRECGADKVLRARLEALLAAHEAPEPIMDAPVPGPTIKLEFADAPDETIGQKIGRYKILERVGEGGCGVVYVAEQTEPVRRRVALKVIKLGMDTKQVVARFEAERQALALMDHPNIAKVLDAGATETGRPYFIMELVRGIKITDYCDQANLTTKERLELFIKVCQAIQHAHQKGVIHRDIKPSNILVTINDGVPVPKVIDFGIAKATEGRLTDATVYTQLHQFIGTPAYMSPEQAEMSSLDIDTRSDIYSLGVLLYELLIGKTPFDVKELISQGLDAMRRTIREVEPTRPSTRLAALSGDELTTAAKRRSVPVHQLQNQLQGDLDWIVMKALEKDRTRRYDTANGLAMDIQRHLNTEPVIARPSSLGYRVGKAVRRNKLAFAAVTAVAGSLVVGIAMSLSEAARAEREAARARAAQQQAMAETARATAAERKTSETLAQVVVERDAKELARQDAEAVSQFLGAVFQSPDPARDGRTITVVETLDKAVKKLESAPAIPPALRARLEATLSGTYSGLGLYDQALALAEKVRDYDLATFGLENTNTFEAMRALANSYDDSGHPDEALKLREQALALDRKVLGPEHPETLRAMGSLAASYGGAGRQDEARQLLEQALPLFRKVLGPEHRDTLTTMGNLARAYSWSGRRDQALKLREQVLSLDRKVLGPEHPQTLRALVALANSYDVAGRIDDTLKLREQVLALDRKVFGAEHPDALHAMENLAISYDEAGRGDEALKLREDALPLDRKILGPEHPETLKAMSNLAASYDAAGRRDEALKLLEQALPLFRKSLGLGHPDTLLAVTALANTYDEAGRRDEALKLREDVVALDRKMLGPEHPATLQAMNDLAWALATSDAAAIRSGTNAVRLAEAVAAATSRKNPDYLDTLAAAYAETQEFDKAVAVEREAIALYQTEPQKKEAGSHLSLYQSNKPYREQKNP